MNLTRLFSLLRAKISLFYFKLCFIWAYRVNYCFWWTLLAPLWAVLESMNVNKPGTHKTFTRHLKITTLKNLRGNTKLSPFTDKQFNSFLNCNFSRVIIPTLLTTVTMKTTADGHLLFICNRNILKQEVEKQNKNNKSKYKIIKMT